MRKAILCLIVSALTLAGSNAFAQEGPETAPTTETEPTTTTTTTQPDVESTAQAYPRSYVGVTGLLNYSSVSYSEDIDGIDTGYSLGFGGGLRGIFEFTPFVGLQPEILFKQYGASQEVDVMGQTAESELSLNYIEVPVLLRIAAPVGQGMINPKLVIGPTFGYFLSGTTEQDGESVDIESDNVSSLQIGGAVGIGADIQAGAGLFNVDLRYDRGFTSVDDDDNEDNDYVNTGFSLMLGYSFAL